MIKHVSLAVLSFVIALPGCKPSIERYSGELSKPAQARIDLKDTTLAKFDERAAKALLRYLAGNERWEVC